MDAQESNSTEQLMTINDVTTLLQCSRQTIYDYVNRGKMPKPSKLGNYFRWRKSAIDQWIDNGMVMEGGKR